MGADDLLSPLAAEGRLTGEELPEDDPKGVEVTAGRQRFAPQALGAEVLDRSRDLIAAGSGGPGEAEVDELDEWFFILAADEDILGFQVTVDKSPGVDVIESCKHLVKNLLQLARFPPLSGFGKVPGEVVQEGLTFEQLHGEIA